MVDNRGMAECRVRKLGRVPYLEALDLQRDLVRRRQGGEIADTLVLVEHPHVVTIGKRSPRDHLLAGEDEIRESGVEVHRTDRGGEVTYHGPGQIVGYPILDLNGLRRDVKWYLEQLEEVMIRTVGRFGVAAGRIEKITGVWVGDRKIGALGVRLQKWVTSHGFALNVSTELERFRLIVPCGIRDKGVTSLSAELGRPVAVGEVEPLLAECFGEVFGREMVHEKDARETPQAR